MRSSASAATTLLLLSTLTHGASAGAPTNPFCGWASNRNTFTSNLSCTNGVIDSLPLALYGVVAGECPTFSPTSCSDKSFASYAAAQCLGKQSCLLSSDRPDPCPGQIKTIAVLAHCSLPPGGISPPRPSPQPSQPPPPPQPPVSPTCALNGLPCPPPQWNATWNLTQSSVIQPSSAGFFTPNHTWGLVRPAVWRRGWALLLLLSPAPLLSVSLSLTLAPKISLDWSVARSIWFTGNQSNTTCEATSREGCRRLKAAGLAHRCL
jgi:hypothetical protein